MARKKVSKPRIVSLDNRSRKGSYVYFIENGKTFYYKFIEGTPLSYYLTHPTKRRGVLFTFRRKDREHIVVSDGKRAMTLPKSPLVDASSYEKAFKTFKKGYIQRSEIQSLARVVESKKPESRVFITKRERGVLDRARKSRKLRTIFDTGKKTPIVMRLPSSVLKSPRLFYRRVFEKVIKNRKDIPVAVANRRKLINNFFFSIDFYNDSGLAIKTKFSGISVSTLSKYISSLEEKSKEGILHYKDITKPRGQKIS